MAPQSQEYGSYIIHAKEANAPIVIYGNVPNRNLISNLPDGCCVEVPIVVDANGLQPTQIGKLPPQLAAICRTNVNVQDLTVEAALTKQREYIYQAVMMDPHTSTTLTLDKIWAMCDEMIEAHQKDGYMGEFAPVIKNTGRAYKGTGDRAIARLKTQGTFSFEAGSTNELQLQIDNPGNEPICTAIGFTSSVEGVRINAMEINVSANSNQSFPVLVSLQTAVKQPIDIDLKTDGSEVLIRGLSLSPRKILEKESAGLSRLELHMRGEVAASGSISRDEDNLHLDITVNDSDIHPAQSSVIGIMAGSAIELRIATSEHTEVTTINIIPGKKGDESSVAFHNTLNKEINVGCIQQTTTPLSYRIAADIPLTETGLDPNASEALIEIRTLLSALGEAHSGGATCLTEQPGRKSTLPYFHKILF